MSSFFDSYQKQKPNKKELPQWYQDSAIGQFARQTQDRANQWFGDVLGVNPQTGITNPLQQYTDPIKQYGEQLQQQGQDWFLQTPVGQGVNDFYTGFFSPMQQALDTRQQTYQDRLNTLYSNYNQSVKKMGEDAMKKMGLR